MQRAPRYTPNHMPGPAIPRQLLAPFFPSFPKPAKASGSAQHRSQAILFSHFDCTAACEARRGLAGALAAPYDTADTSLARARRLGSGSRASASLEEAVASVPIRQSDDIWPRSQYACPSWRSQTSGTYRDHLPALGCRAGRPPVKRRASHWARRVSSSVPARLNEGGSFMRPASTVRTRQVGSVGPGRPAWPLGAGRSCQTVSGSRQGGGLAGTAFVLSAPTTATPRVAPRGRRFSPP